MAVRDDGTKWCPSCRDFKQVSEFYRKKARPDGLSGQCKTCCLAFAKKYAAAHKEQRAATWANCYQKSKDKYSARIKAMRLQDWEGFLAKSRDYAKANRDKKREIEYRWVTNNREFVRAKNRNRAALKRNAPGSHSLQDIKQIYASQRGRCGYCRVKLGTSYDVDHIHALANGGSNDRRNLQLLCPSCNGSKSARDPIDYAQRIGLLL